MFKALQEEVRVASDVVAGTLPMNNFNVLVLFDLGATHPFIARKIVTKLGEISGSNRKGFCNWNFDGEHGWKKYYVCGSGG